MTWLKRHGNVSSRFSNERQHSGNGLTIAVVEDKSCDFIHREW